MPQARWTNQSHPQTLQIAVFLLYANAFFGMLSILRVGLIPLLQFRPWGPLFVATVVGQVIAGRGVASERKWGYGLAVGFAVLPLALRLIGGGALAISSGDLLSLLFEIALVALLLHPQSRDYQRLWFK